MEPATLDERDAAAAPCEVVRPATPLATRENVQLAIASEQARLRGLEDDIHRRALVCLDDVSRWVEIDPAWTEPPAEWVAEIGQERAEQRLRVAKSAWMSAKEAPVGIAVAKSFAVGIAKARATEKGGGGSLSVQQVIFNAPVYEVIEVAGEDG
jgi:hypothetical protein